MVENKKIKIAIISYPFLSFFGGAERYVEEMARGFEHNGVDVTIFSSWNLFWKEKRQTDATIIKIFNFPFTRRFKYYHEMFFNFFVYFLYRKKLRSFDLIIPQAPAAYFLLFDKYLKNKTVPVSYNSPWRRNQKEEKSIYENAFSVICINQACKENILKNYPHIDINKLVVFNEGVHVDKFYPRSTDEIVAMRQKYNIPINKLFLLTLQRMDSRKDLVTLANILINVAKAAPDIFVGIAGGGPDRDKVAVLVDEAGLNNLKMLGFIEENDLSSIYASADAFLSATWGQVALEAMACGVCTFVLNDHPACKENVCDLNLLLPCNQQSYHNILDVIVNRNLCNHYGKKGLEFILDNFKWDIITKKILNHYLQVK